MTKTRTATEHQRNLRSRSWVSTITAITGALLLAAFMIIAPGNTSDQASAATPPTVEVCNGILNADAQTVECHVTVANVYDEATGVGSSTVTVTICAGAPGLPGSAPCAAPIVNLYPEVITAIEQCNGSGNSGGSVVYCDVDIENTITGTSAVTNGTINQCIGSGDGGGALPLNCSPVESTTSATVTQCNGSGNDGGATQRVNCSVDVPVTVSAALTVTVNQCNGSGNGGGAFIVCSASQKSTVTPADTGGGTPGGGTPGSGTPGTKALLAETGAEFTPLVAAGSVALLVGTALMLRSRRNRKARIQ